MKSFTYNGQPSRVVFGAGALTHLEREIDLLHGRRALVLSTPGHTDQAEMVAERLGARCAGIFARAVIAMFRTIPDLVWAIFFIIMVGLGPAAGVLAIMVDKIGFAGRFFAEAMEEADTGPQDALRAIGASRTGLIFSAVFPACLPSFTATSLFALEKAVRGSAALGLVGAGGIGVDLKVAFDLFNYDEALTIILMLFALVLIVEQGSGWIRSKLI